MSDIVINNAQAYAVRHHQRLAERLGFGIHGTVLVAEKESNRDQSAIKAFNSPIFYERERDVYLRLRAARITQVFGFHVPQFIRADDELHVIEMTIVARPFLLDFAGAFLNARPQFPDETWAQWEMEKREQFGSRWSIVLRVLDKLEELGIYLVDVSPSNIAFAD